MSERAQTGYSDEVQERIKRNTKSLRIFVVDEPCDWGAVMKGDVCLHLPEFMADYHIIPNANAVVTEEGLEAAAKMVLTAGWTWEEVDEHSRQHCREAVLAVLESLNITVVDEVVELPGTVLGDEFDIIPDELGLRLTTDKGVSLLHLCHGDILYIKRKQE